MVCTGQFINNLILIYKVWTIYSMYRAESGGLQVQNNPINLNPSHKKNEQ